MRGDDEFFMFGEVYSADTRVLSPYVRDTEMSSVLDFAVQVVHVSNQHVLTTTHPERTSSVIGGYMVFYSLGSALGAAATTSVFTSHGWAASSLLGAGFATCALIVWATDTRRRSRASEVGSEAADAHRGEKEKQRNEAQQAGRVADRSRVF